MFTFLLIKSIIYSIKDCNLMEGSQNNVYKPVAGIQKFHPSLSLQLQILFKTNKLQMYV